MNNKKIWLDDDFPYLEEQIRLAKENHLSNLDDLIEAINQALYASYSKGMATGLKKALRLISEYE